MSSPSNRLMLNGSVDNRDAVIAQLESELRSLRAELAQARSEASAAKQENVRAITALRRALDPLYGALRMVYGEMGGFEVSEAAPAYAAPNSPKLAVWDAWKQKLGGKDADCIDALLQHGTMTAVQLRVVMKCHVTTVYETTAKLQRLGLVNKNGGKYSLKEL